MFCFCLGMKNACGVTAPKFTMTWVGSSDTGESRAVMLSFESRSGGEEVQRGSAVKGQVGAATCTSYNSDEATGGKRSE